MQHENKFDFDLLQRLVFSGFAGGVAITSLFFMLFPILSPLGFMISGCIMMSIFCIVVGVIANAFNLSRFPLLKVMGGKLEGDEKQAAISQVRHVLFALPLSFSAAGLWLTLMGVFTEWMGFSVMIFLISPATIMLIIIHTDSATNMEAFKRSGRTLLLMVSATLILAPTVEVDDRSMDPRIDYVAPGETP